MCKTLQLHTLLTPFHENVLEINLNQYTEKEYIDCMKVSS